MIDWLNFNVRKMALTEISAIYSADARQMQKQMLRKLFLNCFQMDRGAVERHCAKDPAALGMWLCVAYYSRLAAHIALHAHCLSYR